MPSADPYSSLASAVRMLSRKGPQEPIIGTCDEITGEILLDTGQIIPNPIYLVYPPDLGQRVLAFFLQGGHDIAVIPIYVGGG